MMKRIAARDRATRLRIDFKTILLPSFASYYMPLLSHMQSPGRFIYIDASG